MKRESFRRTIKPQEGSKAKPRPGVVGILDRTPETIGELAALMEEQGDPLQKLQNIIDVAESYLKSTKYFSADQDIREQELDPEIESGGPEHHAISAIRFATEALSHIETGNTEPAVRAAMGASFNDVMLWVTRDLEPEAARATAQKPKAPKDKRKRWAVEFADMLVEQNHPSFPKAWDSISSDDGPRCAGYEIFREGDDLIADSASKGRDRIKKGTFRTEYYSRQKSS